MTPVLRKIPKICAEFAKSAPEYPMDLVAWEIG